jgi:predicted nucleotide-binding protein
MLGKQRAIKILEDLRARVLILRNPPGSDSPEFVTWWGDVVAAIKHIFPKQPAYRDRLRGIAFKARSYRGIAYPGADEETFRRGVEKVTAVLQSMTEEIRTYWHEDGTALNPQGTAAALSADVTSNAPAADPRIVFIVHGRNGPARKSLFAFLRAIGLQPLEWSQALSATGEATLSVGQVLDRAFSMAQAVVVLMTPDDEACLRKEFQSTHEEEYEKQPSGQARPDVLFEAGLAMGRNAKRTLLVEVGVLRPFSEVGRQHVIRLDNSLPRRQELAERLKTAGCAVNLVGRDWHSAGSFELT